MRERLLGAAGSSAASVSKKIPTALAHLMSSLYN